jgi:[ribosomal protein S18]-alanine N-acetyltransferase
VAPAWQQHGIGRALLTAIIARSVALGAHAVLLEVRIDNEAAITMYESAGFERLGLRKRYYQPEDVDALTMRLELSTCRFGDNIA